MNEKNTRIMNVCGEMAALAGDEQISGQVMHTEQLLGEAHIPTIALVNIGSAGRSLLDAAGVICGEAVPEMLDRAFEKGPACVTLTYGEEAALCRVGSEGRVRIADAGERPAEALAADELECAFPCGRLKEMNLVLCGGIEDHDAWRDIFENVDAVILRVNATAVMNQTERGWLDQDLLPVFGGAHTAVWVDLMDQLNTDEDREDVLQTVRKALSKRNLTSPVFTYAADAGKWAAAELDGMDVAAQHARKALKICLDQISSRIEQISKCGSIDERAISSALRQLENQRGRLELAGEIAADTTVANAYSKLKIGAKGGVRDFNQQAVASICGKIDNAATEELETLEPKIQTYLRKVWERYQQEMNNRLHEESEKCYAQLMERMEQDAGRMLEELDDETRRVIQAALSSGMAGPEGTLIRPDWEYQGSNSLTKLKTETRNLMLLSIPLVFAHPLLSAAMFFGARYYRKVQTEKRGADFRTALKTQVQSSCDEIVVDICREVDRSFDDASAQMAAAVREAYKSLADNMIRQLQDLSQRQRELTARIDKLQQMQTVTIPSLMCSL